MTGSSTPSGIDPLAVRLQAALGPGYRIGNRIGRGGFAAVYQVRELSLNRAVAVKVLFPELDAPATRERFRREAEAIARLRHPHVIPIYAVGEGAGLAYYIMPLIAGASLRVVLERERRLTVTEAQRILRQTAEALAAAHREGIVHRDIKPDNILLDGDGRSVLLTDFGIARAVADGEALTSTGMILGTPQYMSPEQAGGEAVDHRTDIYSLGVVAHQMLTGEVPFRGPTLGAILLQQLSDPTPLVTALRPECPLRLAQVIGRCLQREPDRRWATADDLVDALTGISRASGNAPTTEAPTDEAVGFRRLLYSMAGVAAAAVGVDLYRGRWGISILVVLICAGLVAVRYGTLWTRGYSLRRLLGRDPGGHWTTSESDESLGLIQEVRNDRAAALRAVAPLPRAERSRLAAAEATIDQLVARAEGLGQAVRELDQRMRQIVSAPHGPARRGNPEVLQSSRAAAVSALRACRVAMATIRGELERAVDEGTSAATPELERAVVEARAAARPAGRETEG